MGALHSDEVGGRPAGREGAETRCLLINGFVDGMQIPARFNEAGSTVLPKKKEPPKHHWGDTIRSAEALRPLVPELIMIRRWWLPQSLARCAQQWRRAPMPHREVSCHRGT